MQTKGKFDGPISGVACLRGAYIREEKHLYLQSVEIMTFISFFQHIVFWLVFWHISRRARCEICPKLTIRHQNM